MVDTTDPTRVRDLPPDCDERDLLVPVFRDGDLVYDVPDIHTAKATTQSELDSLSHRSKRLLNPHIYPVGLDPQLFERKQELVRKARLRAETAEGSQ